jgi:hypothetical protein
MASSKALLTTRRSPPDAIYTLIDKTSLEIGHCALTNRVSRDKDWAGESEMEIRFVRRVRVSKALLDKQVRGAIAELVTTTRDDACVGA